MEDGTEEGNFLLSDYDFMPSIEFKILDSSRMAEYKAESYGDVFDYDSEDNISINTEKLKKYVKFYIKALTRGSNVE